MAFDATNPHHRPVLDIVLTGICTSLTHLLQASLLALTVHQSATLSDSNHEAGVRRTPTSGMFHAIGPVTLLNFGGIQRLSHLITVMWQSAIPPTVCTVLLCSEYIRFAISWEVCSYLHPSHGIPGFVSCTCLPETKSHGPLFTHRKSYSYGPQVSRG